MATCDSVHSVFLFSNYFSNGYLLLRYFIMSLSCTKKCKCTHTPCPVWERRIIRGLDLIVDRRHINCSSVITNQRQRMQRLYKSVYRLFPYYTHEYKRSSRKAGGWILVAPNDDYLVNWHIVISNDKYLEQSKDGGRV